MCYAYYTEVLARRYSYEQPRYGQIDHLAEPNINLTESPICTTST